MDQSWIQSPFLDPIRRAIRVRHYSIRTEQRVGEGVSNANPLVLTKRGRQIRGAHEIRIDAVCG
jgi:hypothetical protein